MPVGNGLRLLMAIRSYIVHRPTVQKVAIDVLVLPHPPAPAPFSWFVAMKAPATTNTLWLTTHIFYWLARWSPVKLGSWLYRSPIANSEQPTIAATTIKSCIFHPAIDARNCNLQGWYVPAKMNCLANESWSCHRLNCPPNAFLIGKLANHKVAKVGDSWKFAQVVAHGHYGFLVNGL